MAKTEKKTEQTNANPANSLDDLKKDINKKFGSGSIMLGRGSVVKVDAFSSGVASIDMAFGCLGLPLGRILEVFGAESSGKTTTCLQFISACQKHYFTKKSRYGVAAFIDAEHALDPSWAEKVGVSMDQLLVSQPDTGEEGIAIAERLVDSGLIDLIIIDSVPALTPKAVLDGEVGDNTMAAVAQLMSKAMNRLKGKCHKTQTTIIFINQIREKVGIVFGNPEITPGGRALKFYASIRAEIKKGTPIKSGDAVVGFRPTIKMVKNKVAAPFVTGEYDICVGHKDRPVFGIDTVASVLDVAANCNIITRNGSFFVYGDVRLGNGFNNAVNFLRANDQMLADIKKKIYDTAADQLQDMTTSEDIGSFDDEVDDLTEILEKQK